MTPPRFAWYGDDFTGASDTLAVVTQAGLRALLFLGVPTAAQRTAAGRALGGPLDAIGIAGATRSMTPAAMEAELAPVGAFFAALGSPLLHYKVCSTFDSAPTVGSIATAMRTLRPHVGNAFVPVVGGQPNLGRYCAFSNLFAAAGRGGAVERLDRHPTMRCHPVTPMQEADLRRHLALQGLEPVAALHYPLYALPEAQQDAALRQVLATQPPAVLMDVADPSHLAPVGRLLWREARQAPLLAVGPSGVAQALVAHWRASGELADTAACLPSGAARCGQPAAEPASPARLAPAHEPVVAFAGSLSPVTARQVRAATAYTPLMLEPADLLDARRRTAAMAHIHAVLDAGRHVIAGTTPVEPAMADTREAGSVARATSAFLRELVHARIARGRPLRRLGIAGGDTSSLAVQSLGLWGLSYAGTLGDGVTVSRAHAEDAGLDGLELMLKGGQMGGEDVFQRLLD